MMKISFYCTSNKATMNLCVYPLQNTKLTLLIAFTIDLVMIFYCLLFLATRLPTRCTL